MIDRSSGTQYDDGNKITINMFASAKIQRLSCEEPDEAQDKTVDWMNKLIAECEQLFPFCEFDYGIYQHEQEYQARMYAELTIKSVNSSYKDAAEWMQERSY